MPQSTCRSKRGGRSRGVDARVMLQFGGGSEYDCIAFGSVVRDERTLDDYARSQMEAGWQ